MNARVRVVTAMRFPGSIERTWESLMFYEQIPSRPPFPLRLLLPEPIRAEGSKSGVGDEIRCLYRTGYLLKRLTRVVPCHDFCFEVVKQELPIAGGIRLAGGGYTLRELPDGSTRVELETQYDGSRRPGWLWIPIQAAVCHAFHRHILGAMRRIAFPMVARSGSPAPAPGSRPAVL